MVPLSSAAGRWFPSTVYRYATLAPGGRQYEARITLQIVHELRSVAIHRNKLYGCDHWKSDSALKNRNFLTVGRLDTKR